MIAKLKEYANNNTIRFALVAVICAILIYLVFDFLLPLIFAVAWLIITVVLAENEVIEEHKVPTVKESVKEMQVADEIRQAEPIPATPKLDKKKSKRASKR